MRRSDREIQSFEEIIRVMEQCDVCRLALHDQDYPYILPLNFGMQVENGTITLYFHGASKGKKLQLLARDNRASFEMDCSHQLVTNEEKGSCSMNYESVIGRGRVEVVPEEEKLHALGLIMAHYHEEDFAFNRALVPGTTVLKLAVEEVTGKARRGA